MRYQYRNKWRSWFAWRPIKVHDFVVWLEFVERAWCRDNDIGRYRWHYILK